MSSETIVTAIFLITAVVAAGILTSQIFPAIYSISGSVSTSTHSADQTLRTDIAIVNTFSLNDTNQAEIWLKNTGSTRISFADLNMSTIFVGNPGNIGTVSLTPSPAMAGTMRSSIARTTTGPPWKPSISPRRAARSPTRTVRRPISRSCSMTGQNDRKSSP